MLKYRKRAIQIWGENYVFIFITFHLWGRLEQKYPVPGDPITLNVALTPVLNNPSP